MCDVFPSQVMLLQARMRTSKYHPVTILNNFRSESVIGVCGNRDSFRLVGLTGDRRSRKVATLKDYSEHQPARCIVNDFA